MNMVSRLALRGVLLSALVMPALAGSAAPAAPLGVARILPAPGSVEVSQRGLVSIVFDRPVVPLARLGSGPPAATISPPVPGQQRWLGTATWALIPTRGLAPATTYTVRLNSALRAIDGTIVSAGASWQFSTVRPLVESVTPGRDAEAVSPRAAVDVTFNLPVVHGSAQAHFALRRGPGGAALPGAFTWRNSRTMRFTPGLPLPRGASLLVQESAGVAALGGPLPGARAFSSSFSVVPAFRLRDSSPAGGASRVDPYSMVQLHFTAPVDLNHAARYLSVRPPIDALHVDLGDQDVLSLSISGNFRPSTTYRVLVRAGLPDLLGDRLSATRALVFTTAPYKPGLSLLGLGSLNTYDAYRPVRVYATATNVDRVTFSLYRQSERQFLQANAPDFNRSTYTPSGLRLIARYGVPVHSVLNRRTAVGQVLVGPNAAPLSPGYYALFAGAPGVADLQYLPLLVTRSSLTLKVGDDSVLLWANDVRSGAPLAGLPVRVVNGDGRLVLRGQTGADGVYRASVGPRVHLGYQTLRALLDRPADVAAVGTEWSDGINPYDYNLNYDPTLTRVRLYLNTDRPIYRPGQTVYYRALARRDDDGRYHMLPAGSRIHLVATDGLNHTIVNSYLRVDAQGVASGRLALSAGASLGAYTLQATAGDDSVSANFTVAAYKKPTFKVLVLADRGENGNYVRGDSIGVSMRADYYFGAPLARAPIQWSVSSASTTFGPDGYDGYDFIDPDVLYAQLQSPSNEQITQIAGQTDPYGAAALRVPAGTAGSPGPRTVTIEANVSGPDNGQVAERSTVVVHPAAVYVGLRPQQYLAAPGTPQGIDVVALRPSGRVAPGTMVTLALQRRVTYSVLQYDPQGSYLWQNRTRDETLRTFSVTTDPAGRAVVHVVLPDAGEYRIVANARDGRGNGARTATFLYCLPAGGAGGYIDWGIANNDRIKLVADRRQYTIGQTAHILVSAPYAGMTALVTLERGTILSHRVMTLRGNSPVLDIPITSMTVPNLYVGVVLFRGAGASQRSLPVWKMGYTTLVVNAREHALTVRVRPLEPHARPGQRVTFAIHTQDAQGRAVSADVGLSLVDAAVLALADNVNGTPTSAFYTQRPLGIQTAASMTLFIDRLNLTPGDGKKGGGGAGAGSVRARFPDTAYWNPNVITDARGNATVSLILPDNLTTWHMRAEGSTATTTLLGDGGADLVSAKPVLVEPALPRFLTVRDHSRLGAVVTNTTDSAVRLNVGGSIVATTRHPATDDRLPAIAVTVPAHSDRAVYWEYVPGVEGSLRVTLRAVSARHGLSDALAVGLPVEENSLVGAEATATSRDATGAMATEQVRLPGAVEPGEGDLRLTLEPTLVAGLAPAAGYLLSYPYDCVEQMTSRLDGMLSLSLLPSGLGLTAGQRAAIPDLVARTVGRLYAQQNSDGGWGWWPEDESDPYLSAYAYEGLLLLKEGGYTVDSTVLANAVGYLQGRLAAAAGDRHAPDDATRAFILYALARGHHPDGAAAAALYDRRKMLGPGPQAQLALALSAAFTYRDDRVRGILRELSDGARLTSTDAHWEAGAGNDWETMESSVSDTALVVRALITLDAPNPLIARAVRWLMARRGVNGDGGPAPDGAWQSTEATALALRSVVLYALRNGDTQARYGYHVMINGVAAGHGTVTPATAGQPRVITVPIDLLRAAGGKAAVTILRTALPGGPAAGAIPLHYTLRLRYYPTPGSVGAVQSGISVTRRYLSGGRPVAGGAASGKTLTVELRLVAPQELSRVVIEDPLPAGAEAVDGTLLTTSVFAQPGDQAAAYSTPPQPGQPGDLGLYVDHTELRDDRVALFATSIPAGTYVYRYAIHLTSPGTYHVLPAHAAQLYEPEVFGHTAEESFTVR